MEAGQRTQLSFTRGRALWVAFALLLATLLVRLPARGAEPAPRPVPVVDLHVDLPYQLGYKSRSFARGTGQFPARALARAGVVGVVLPLFVPAKVSPSGVRLEDLRGSYRRVVQAIAATEPYLAPGCNAAPGKVRTFLAFEGAGPLADDPALLDEWVGRGLRSVGLVHTRKNALASSSGDTPQDNQGLTDAGRRLVQRAQALGVPIDVSHASDRALADVLELARAGGAKVIATHSNARALADVPRNLDDAAIRAIAATGGVIGVNFHSPFLVRGRRATLADVVRHVLHLVRVAGPEHVALGSDFEGDIRPPSDLPDVTALPRLSAALTRAGLSEDVIASIFSGNALRVLCGERGQ